MQDRGGQVYLRYSVVLAAQAEDGLFQPSAIVHLDSQGQRSPVGIVCPQIELSLGTAARFNRPARQVVGSSGQPAVCAAQNRYTGRAAVGVGGQAQLTFLGSSGPPIVKAEGKIQVVHHGQGNDNQIPLVIHRTVGYPQSTGAAVYPQCLGLEHAAANGSLSIRQYIGYGDIPGAAAQGPGSQNNTTCGGSPQKDTPRQFLIHPLPQPPFLVQRIVHHLTFMVPQMVKFVKEKRADTSKKPALRVQGGLV